MEKQDLDLDADTDTDTDVDTGLLYSKTPHPLVSTKLNLLYKRIFHSKYTIVMI